jgi:hypothetical protein
MTILVIAPKRIVYSKPLPRLGQQQRQRMIPVRSKDQNLFMWIRNHALMTHAHAVAVRNTSNAMAN